MSEAAPSPDIRVLLVDGDDGYRTDLARALRAERLSVIEARTTFEALDVLNREPMLRFAVVEAYMPPQIPNGIALGRVMKSRDKTSQIVLIAARPDVIDFPDVGEFGGVLLKTPNMSFMAVAIVRKLLNSG